MIASSSAPPRPALSADHEALARDCLDLLEQAQALCRLAAEALCPVPGFGNEWSYLVGYDAVKGDWHLVNGRLAEMRENARQGRCPACGQKPAESSCSRCGFQQPPAADPAD